MQVMQLQSRGSENNGTIFPTSPLVVEAQELENFNCTFSECAGEDVVCYCSVPHDTTLFWWDGNSSFCSITFISNSMKTDNHDLVAEVVDTSPSGGFTSKLTRRNVSAGLNGTEMGCSQSQIDQDTCRPSTTDQNSRITLNVHSCQGKAWSQHDETMLAMIAIAIKHSLHT